MTITKEQWVEVERQLSGPIGRCELSCDGYEVVARVATIAALQLGIVVYVNGWVRGEWMKGEAEEARKFHREMKRYIWSARLRTEAAKKAKGRHLPADLRKVYQDRVTASVSTWAPYWTNAKAFTRHLRKTCADISVVKIGY